MLTPVFVAVRIIANPVSNVFQKQLTRHAANPIFVIGATHAVLTALSLPLLPMAVTPALGPDFWTTITICALLAVTGNVLLVYALRAGDLSLLGPINSYKVVLSLILAIFLLDEIPTPMGLGGVLLILAGSYVIVGRDPGRVGHNALSRFFRQRGVPLRFAALAMSAMEAVFLKQAIVLSSPLTTFVLWSILGLPIAAAAIGFLLRAQFGDQVGLWWRQWRTYLCLAATTGLMQLATLFTFGKLPVGYALALFQLSTLLSVFLGHHYFQEQHLRRRLLGSAVMVAGAVLIIVLGRETP